MSIFAESFCIFSWNCSFNYWTWSLSIWFWFAVFSDSFLSFWFSSWSRSSFSFCISALRSTSLVVFEAFEFDLSMDFCNCSFSIDMRSRFFSKVCWCLLLIDSASFKSSLRALIWSSCSVYLFIMSWIFALCNFSIPRILLVAVSFFFFNEATCASLSSSFWFWFSSVFLRSFLCICSYRSLNCYCKSAFAEHMSSICEEWVFFMLSIYYSLVFNCSLSSESALSAFSNWS